MSFKIIGLGSYLPNKPISNDELSKFVDTNDDWIKARTGIEQRYFSNGVSNAQMSYLASLKAIEDSKINKEDIDYIIVCTTSPDMTFPSTACYLQKKLDIRDIPAFDINAACAGFIYGLHMANMIFKTENNVKNILLVGTDKLSESLNFEERSTAVLFGDGSGAAILSRSQDGFFASKIYADGTFADSLYAKKTYDKETPNEIFMNGADIFRYGITKMYSSSIDILEQNNIKIEDIDFFIPHQANIRMINTLGDKLQISHDKIAKTVSIHANTSAGTIPLALDFYKKEGKIKNGSLCLLTAAGAGLAWGAAIIRF